MRGRALLLTGLIVTAAAPALAAPDADLAAALALAGGADVVSFDLPAMPGAPRVRAVTAVRAPPDRITAVLLDAARLSSIIPAMVRSDVRGQTVDWELEVPLFNLSGKATLRPLTDGVEIALIDGDLAPGRVIFRVAARPGGGSILEADAQLDVRRSSFFIRQVMKRSPFGEPAALAAVAWVALRATALRAEHAELTGAWRPGAPIEPPNSWMPDTRLLADARLAALRARGALALVARLPSERLGGIAVAVPAGGDAGALGALLRDPRRWRAFPGWKKVQPGPAATPGAPRSAVVEDSIPFVDFDATWTGEPGGGLRWTAAAGAARGARLGWDVAPSGAAGTVLVLSLYPRLEKTGRIPRGFIDAEPLLEHGLALALAFVDVAGVAAALRPAP